MRCARAIAGPKVDFQTQPVFDEERHHSDDDDGGGVEAHPKIIGMTDSEGKGGREGGREGLSLCRSLFLP